MFNLVAFVTAAAAAVVVVAVVVFQLKAISLVNLIASESDIVVVWMVYVRNEA